MATLKGFREASAGALSGSPDMADSMHDHDWKMTADNRKSSLTEESAATCNRPVHSFVDEQELTLALYFQWLCLWGSRPADLEVTTGVIMQILQYHAVDLSGCRCNSALQKAK